MQESETHKNPWDFEIKTDHQKTKHILLYEQNATQGHLKKSLTGFNLDFSFS